MKLLIENFRQYLDADEDTLTGLSFKEMSQALRSSMGGAKLALTILLSKTGLTNRAVQ